ncbi:toxin TcdB middle/N-terminal domain-containing protein [Dokdonella soli]|uniref:Insecticide toxin TcdB middle/N-terminal domain-containing protein n=1 Tax=Dokdonella soli TaxID=529810 RepID=A0ABN1IEN9_9GAMM
MGTRESGIEVKSATGTTLRYYEPAYNTSASWQRYRPRLLSLKECDRQGGACYPPTNFTWTSASPTVEEFTGSMGSGLGYYQFGDFTGDKRADLWWTSNAAAGGRNNQLHISGLSVDAQGKPAMVDVYSMDTLLPDGFLNGGLWEVFDIDGDGRDDLLFAWANRDGSPSANPNQITWIRRLATNDCSGGQRICLGPEEVLFTVPVNSSAAAELSRELVAQIAGGADGGAPATPVTPSDLRYLGSSMLADVDGDGLSDLVFRAPDGLFWVALTQRTNIPASPFVLNPIQAAFLDEAGSPVGNRCGFATASLSREEENFSQAVDFDGDGRADLRFMVDARGCAGYSGFRLDVFLSKGQRSSDGKFVFQAARPFGDVVIGANDPAGAARKLRTVDVNGDGLADLVYMDSGNVWRFRMGGPFSVYTDNCIADCSLKGGEHALQLLDFDGDGKLDFWRLNGSKYDVYLWAGSGWAGLPSSPALQGLYTGYHFPDTTWSRMTADFDGDGIPDNFLVRPADGTWHLQRTTHHHRPRGVVTEIVSGLGAKTTITYAPLTFSSVYLRDYDAPFTTSGRGSPVFDVAAPSYVVRSVSSSAPIQNDPTAASTVSYRYAGLKVQAGGRGSLGFRRISTTDSQSGIEVDSYYQQRFPYTGLADFTETRNIGLVANDADPCNGATGPDSAACMKYVPKCKAGRATTCDDDLPGINDASRTIKSSADRWQWRTSAGTAALEPYCENGAVTSSVGAMKAPGASDQGAICLNSGHPPIMPDEYDRRLLALAQAPIFIARIESLTSSYDLASGVPGGALISESVAFPLASYDAYGNPLSSTASKSGGGTTVSLDSTFQYDNDEPNWRLGRLRTSTVKTTRAVGGSVLANVRRSSFTYDAKGLLASEKVEGMAGQYPNGLNVDASAPSVAAYYTYDPFGNRTKTSTCSTTIPESSCRAQSASSGGYPFHPTDPTAVMRYTNTDYDSLGRFADATREAYSAGGGTAQERTRSRVYARNAAGDPTEITDANGVSSKIRYGALGRKRFMYSPNGGSTRWDARYCSGMPVAAGMPTVACPSGMGLAYRSMATTAGSPGSMVYHDLLGRPTVALVQGFEPGSWIGTITQYDARGSVKRKSDPYRVLYAGVGAATPAAGVTITWTESTYDALSRPTTIVQSGTGATTTLAYDGLKTVTTSPANGSGLTQTRTELKNGLGEVVKTIDVNGLEVSTQYDAAGNVMAVVHGASTTVMTYDSLGRKIGMSDPDAGTWTYAVNGAGEVIRQVSPRGTCTKSEYDGRGRVWHRRDHSNAACSQLESEASWSYDTALSGIGALAEEVNSQVRRTPSYDSLGRAVRVDTVLDGKTYVEQWSFDQFGRPFQHFFTAPGLPTTGERHAYGAEGYLSQVRSAYPKDGAFLVYREILEMNARGQVTKERGAAGAEYTQERAYDDNTGRLTRQLAQSASGLLQDFGYSYDLVGNLTSRTNRREAVGVTETFTYDALQRLRQGVVTSAGQTTFARTQSYDAEGNIAYKSDAGLTYVYGTRPAACAENAMPGPHALSLISGVSLCYDANGNVLKQTNSLGSQTIQYTAADQASDIRDTVNNARVGFSYGPNRERVRRLDYASSVAVSADTVVHWAGDAQIRYTASVVSGANGLLEVRRTIGNTLVVQTGSGATYRLKRQILLTDAQGSTHQVLGAMTLTPVNASSPTSFDSWGRRRDGTTWAGPTLWTAGLESLLRETTTRGYTGHEMAESVGVIHMNGRIYDPQLARFLQADPFVQSPQDLQSWNRYSYGFNNPLAYTDPSGYFSAGDFLRTAAAIAITVYSGGTAAGATWGLFGTSVVAGSAQSFAIMAVGGFAAGAVQTGSLRGAVTGAVTATVFYGVGNAFTPTNASWAYSGNQMTVAGHAVRSLAHGAAGGVMTELQGGRFGHGFMSAGISAALSPSMGRNDSFGVTAAKTIQAAAVGGTASVLAGGKFANGAVTAAFGFAFARIVSGVGGQGSGPGDGSLEAKLRVGGSRGLSAGEIAMASGVFGSDVNYDDVLVYRKKFHVFQPREIAMTPNGNMYFHPEAYLDDFSLASVDSRAWFLHEMVHVWQHQQGINVAWGGIFDRNYDYGTLVAAPPGKPFSSFGIEQQGDIVRDYYYLGQGVRVQGAAPISTYQSILPFSRGW